jgi:hypothetical protein
MVTKSNRARRFRICLNHSNKTIFSGRSLCR